MRKHRQIETISWVFAQGCDRPDPVGKSGRGVARYPTSGFSGTSQVATTRAFVWRCALDATDVQTLTMIALNRFSLGSICGRNFRPIEQHRRKHKKAGSKRAINREVDENPCRSSVYGLCRANAQYNHDVTSLKERTCALPS